MSTATIIEMNHDLHRIKREVIPSLQAQMHYTQVLIGDYKYSTRDTDELGWLQCDGRLLDRTQYSALFNIVGTAFGSTNSTNFRLPDFRGRVPGDAGATAGLTSRNLGDKVGAETHVLTVTEMPSHDHGGSTGASGYGTGVQDIAALGTSGIDAANNAGNHAHSISAQGGGQAHNNMQPTIFAGYTYIFAGTTYATDIDA
jgi:microcystin-dependent protein